MTSSLQSPARYYMSDYREKAAAFCRSLVAGGLQRQAAWKPRTHIPQNAFRTYTRPATATRPTRYIVSYQDWTPGPSVAKPSRFCDLTKRKARVRCVNGCARKNESRSGECHACRCRRLYATDETYRAAKLARTREAGARRRQRMREDPEYRAEYNARRREWKAKRRAGVVVEFREAA